MKANERSQTILLLVGLVVVAVVLSLAVLGGSSATDGPGSDRQAAGQATCGDMTYKIQMVRNPYDERQLRVDVS